MGKVRVLPDSVANRIAAGEVIERPASIVKELLENAVDAGAARIDIEVEAGGRQLVRISDDGEGMTRDDAITAFERHATSKLRNADELEAIGTLGFRGEALPSIAAVSKLTLRTKTIDDPAGTELRFHGGKLLSVHDVAWPGGTEIEVKDLFFNTPARRKFLKSDSTEAFHISNLVQHYALAKPDISFLLVRDGREIIRVARAGSLRERAYQVLGGSLLEKLVEIESETGGTRVFGFVSNPQEQRSSRDAQYVFVNGRFVRDRLVWRALGEAYRSTMPSGCYPSAILFIELPPAEVDVNVHPAKTEVRFLHESMVLSIIKNAVDKGLARTQPITRFPAPRQPATREPRYDLVGNEATPAERPPEPTFALESASPYPARERQEEIHLSFQSPAASRGPEKLDGASESSEQDMPRLLPGLGHGIKPLGQIRDSYIVATDEEGLLLIDQHVAHERVLFEQLRGERQHQHGTQPLLIPETLDLSPAEAEAFTVVQDELERLGIELMQMSGRTVAIKSTPAGLGAADAAAVVRETLMAVDRERRDSSLETIREGIAASMACKAAIKINMPLTSEKMQWLIDELLKTRNPMTCPHGRPIIMRFGLREIERGFKRPV
jgi:DNA mismatch repair protein MutL